MSNFDLISYLANNPLLIKENEGNKILIPRRSPEEREKNFNINIQKKIQQYIKDGSKGDLDLENTKITSLPNTLTTVGGKLILRHSSITSLPDNLTVKGYLDISKTKITSLPNDLTVGGDFLLFFTPLSEKYTKEEIRQMVPNVKGKIYLQL